MLLWASGFKPASALSKSLFRYQSHISLIRLLAACISFTLRWCLVVGKWITQIHAILTESLEAAQPGRVGHSIQGQPRPATPHLGLCSLIGFLLFTSLQIALQAPELVVEFLSLSLSFFFIWLIRFSKSPKPEGFGKEKAFFVKQSKFYGTFCLRI